MGFVKSWIFWFLFALVPFVLALLVNIPVGTVVFLYFIEVAIAIILWAIYGKTRKLGPDEY